MKVFAVTFRGSYSGGLTIVAANDEAEAVKIWDESPAEDPVPFCYVSKNSTFYKVEKVELLPLKFDGEARTIHQYQWSE